MIWRRWAAYIKRCGGARGNAFASPASTVSSTAQWPRDAATAPVAGSAVCTQASGTKLGSGQSHHLFAAPLGRYDVSAGSRWPLDNNLCERTLKRAVLYRKNALFYRTLHGAEAGDLFMSLIHTCELAGANPFNYLAELQRHPAGLASNPAAWMPWNYAATLARVGLS
jgi:hypothetical protein